MESRKISGFPQVPLCHIVTSLILFIIRNIHTPTCTPTYLWISPKELPAVVNYRSTKGREGGRGALINGWMDPEEPEGEVNLKCWADVPSTLPPNALEWVLCHVSSFYGPLSKVFWFLPSVFNTGLQCCWTVSQSSVIFEFNIKCGTRWQTLWGKSKEIRITLMLELLSSWERIKKKRRNRVKMAPRVLQLQQPAGHHLSILTLLLFLEKQSTCVIFYMCCLCSLFEEWTTRRHGGWIWGWRQWFW